MHIKPIRNEQSYNEALARIDALISTDPVEGSVEYDELDIVSTLVDNYEETHYPIAPPDPIEAIKYIMQERGLNKEDLVQYFEGDKRLVSEVLNNRHELSKRVIKSLHEGLGIPYEILMA
jgi:HTH-type transcriptional regulator/antitoxin HigA